MEKMQVKGYGKNLISPEFKVFFLLKFTKELVKNSTPKEVLELKTFLKEKDKEDKAKIRQIIVRKEKIEKEPKLSGIFLREKPIFQIPRRKPVIKRLIPNVLRIPESRLPPRLQYIKPIASGVEIDLGKLNPLLKDPAVKFIESNGSGKNIIVGGVMGRKKTNIILNKEEINGVIKKFSETAKIPIQEGIIKIAVGRFILSAIISEVTDSKFIIKKMMPNARPKFFK